MSAQYQYRLTDWPSVPKWIRLQTRWRSPTTTTNMNCISILSLMRLSLNNKTHVAKNNFQGKQSNKTNSVALSPRANYTDWVTATFRRNLVPTSADRGVSRGQHGGTSTVVNLRFLDRSRYFSFKYLLIYPHKGWVDPVLDPLLLRKSGSAGKRTQASGSAARNSDH
jgi:hypothetical protein